MRVTNVVIVEFGLVHIAKTPRLGIDPIPESSMSLGELMALAQKMAPLRAHIDRSNPSFEVIWGEPVK